MTLLRTSEKKSLASINYNAVCEFTERAALNFTLTSLSSTPVPPEEAPTPTPADREAPTPTPADREAPTPTPADREPPPQQTVKPPPPLQQTAKPPHLPLGLQGVDANGGGHLILMRGHFPLSGPTVRMRTTAAQTPATRSCGPTAPQGAPSPPSDSDVNCRPLTRTWTACREQGLLQFSSVQFKMVSMRSEKPICTCPWSLRSFPLLPLKLFQCLSG